MEREAENIEHLWPLSDHPFAIVRIHFAIRTYNTTPLLIILLIQIQFVFLPSLTSKSNMYHTRLVTTHDILRWHWGANYFPDYP